jgi:dTDP-4-dehydrorhamnose reductase
MEKILVTGATGQLGSELNVLSLNYPQYEWIFADRIKITLDNLELLQVQLNEIKPDVIFNCGAYTAVDKAETEKRIGFYN